MLLFLGIYAAAVLSVVICFYWAPFRYVPVVYLIAGFGLNRGVLTRIHWHHYTVTLSTVAWAKLRALVTWPIAYPVLFFQILVARYF